MSKFWFFNTIRILWISGAVCLVSAIIFHLVGDFLNDRNA